MLTTIKHIHGGNLWAAALDYGVNPKELLDYSANINPLGPVPGAYEAIKANLETILHYPDPHCCAVKEALSRWTGQAADNMVMGNGAVELIYLLMATLKPERVLIPAPTFSEYEAAVLVAGGSVVDFLLPEENKYKLDVEALAGELPGVDLVVLCNPNNPTGHLLTREEVLYVVREAAKHRVFVLVDEAFMDFVAEKDNYSVAGQVEEFSNLFVSYSLTKFLGIPGLRLGAGLGNGRLIRELTDRKDPWNVNCLAQIAGVASLEDVEHLEKSKEFVQSEKDYLWGELAKITGIEPFYPSVNYILIKLTAGWNSKSLQQELAPFRIMVRDCASFKNMDDTYIRVAVKDRKSNERLLNALRAICGEGEK